MEISGSMAKRRFLFRTESNYIGPARKSRTSFLNIIEGRRT